MKRQVNPLIAAVAAVFIIVIACGIYVYTGATSTHGHTLHRNVQASGGPAPEQKFIPKAP